MNKKLIILREYTQLASQYDKRWAFYVEATVRETIKRLRLYPVDRLLDVGCGTGALLKALSLEFPKWETAGVDPSAEMLNVARQKLADRVLLRRGWAEDLPFQNKNFDIVVSCSAFHFCENPEKALREFRRVLKPNGRIIITDWCHDYFTCRIHDLFLHIFNRAHIKTHGSQECELMFKKAGFNNIKTERYKLNWLWGMMTITGSNPNSIK